MTILATLCIVYLEPAIAKLSILLQKIGSNWNSWFILLAFFLIPLAIGTFLKTIGGFRFKDFNIIHSYANPPVWYASLFGICLYPILSFHLSKSPCLEEPLFYWIICFFVLLFFIGTLIGILWKCFSNDTKYNKPVNTNNKKKTAELLKDPEKIIQWLQKEKPIANTDEDLFDSEITARRIARTLTQESFKTISLNGPYGSGKTSILNLAEKNLQNQKDKIIISISAWGYEDKKLTAYILRNIIRRISTDTDCLNVCLVPIKFQTIFLDNSWGLLNFLKFLFVFETPESLIRKINDILKRYGKELIIFLEDIDRNQNNNIHHQLYSLFNYFVDMDSIAFVVTYASDSVIAEPLTKITDKTEIVPKLNRLLVEDCIDRFRSFCYKKYDDIPIPGFDFKENNQRIGILEEHGRDYYRIRRHLNAEMDRDPDIFDCLTELLRYPRQLKRALSQTWTVWQKLHGEIYFDDLLVLQTIKVTACSLFHLLTNNIDNFKIFATTKKEADITDLLQKVETALDQEQITDKLLYHKLIQFLFPGWHYPAQSKASKIANNMYRTLNPQGVASDSNVDYFARACAEELPENEIPDQSVMRYLLKYNSGEYSPAKVMGKLIKSEHFADRVEYFGKLLKPSKVLDLTSQYLDFFSKHPEINVRNSGLAVTLHRMPLDNYETVENHKSWLEHQIVKYLPKSLQLTNDIFGDWGYRTRSDRADQQHPIKCHEFYQEKIQKLITNINQFVNVLKYDMPCIWTLRHAVFCNFTHAGIKQSSEQAKDAFFSPWQPWLAESLIKASTIEPAIIAMYSAPLIYDINNITTHDAAHGMMHGWEVTFDSKISELLFGDNLKPIMEIISVLKEEDYKDYKNLDEQAKKLLDYAVTHSKQWILDQSHKSKKTEKAN